MRKPVFALSLVLLVLLIIGSVTAGLIIYSRKQAVETKGGRETFPAWQPQPRLYSRSPRPASQEEKERALVLVRAFMEQPDLPLKFPGKGEVKSLERDLEVLVLTSESGTDATGFGDKTFVVELKRNYVLQAYFRDAVYRSSAPYRFDPAQSESLATAFAENHFPNFYNKRMTLKKRNTPDEMVSVPKSYEFVWRTENTPSRLSVIISPVTGEVISYYAFIDNGKIDTVPKISKERALRTVRREINKGRVGLNIRQVKEAGLYVSYSSNNKPTLVWGFELEGLDEFDIETIITPPNPVPVVEVDALTDNISYVGPSQ